MPIDPVAHFFVERLRCRDVNDCSALFVRHAGGERNRMICLAGARAAQNEMSFRHYVRPIDRDTD